jgi:hypothetical protein
MIHLPVPPQRSWVIGFWVSFNGLAALGLGGILTGLFGVKSALLAMLFILLLGAAGRIRDWRLARLAYGAWTRLATGYAAVAGWLVLRLCYYLIVLPVGKCGSALQLDRRTSVWTPRIGGTGRGVPAAFDRSASLQETWLRNYLRWATGSGNEWALMLVPFLAFLSAVGRAEADPDVPTNIYTLY